MHGRAARIRRIAGVERQMRRAAEWKLHDLKRQEDALRLAQDRVLAALARDDGLFVALAPALSRRLGGLAAEADALLAAADRQQAALRAQTGRVKQIERLDRVLAAAAARVGDRLALEELVDLVAARNGARARARLR